MESESKTNISANGTAAITLQFPITAKDGRKIEKVTVRRLKVRDLKMVSHHDRDEDKIWSLLPHVVQEAPEDLDMMDAEDWFVVRGKILDFLGLPTTA